MRAVFPGSFDPITVGHLAVADAAHRTLGLVRLDLVISVSPLAKAGEDQAPAGDRLAAITRATASRPWLTARVSEQRLVADIAAGYDACVMGADKWAQVCDPAFYDDEAARDAALARLPTVALAPRAGYPSPTDHPLVEVVILDVDDWAHEVSSTGVRQGRHDWRP